MEYPANIAIQPPATARDIVRKTLSSLGQLWRGSFLLWVAPAIVAAGTDLTDFFADTPQAHRPNAVQIVSLAVRLFFFTWFVVGILRILVQSPARKWALDWGVLFYLAWALIGEAIAVGISAALDHGGRWVAAQAGMTAFWEGGWHLVAFFIALPLTALLLLPLLPWEVALATRVRGISLRLSLRRMCHLYWQAARSYLLLVAPLFVIHAALTAWLQRATLLPAPKVALIVAGSLESVVLLLVGAALYAAIFRLAVPEDSA